MFKAFLKRQLGGRRVLSEEFEEYVLKNLDELIANCSDVCDVERLKAIKIADGLKYEGCELCVVKTALDKLSLPTYSITYEDGRFSEFVLIPPYVLDVRDQVLYVMNYESFKEYINDLLMFNAISVEVAEEIVKWFESITSKSS